MSARESIERFESLVREHHAAVYRTAQRIVLNVEDAQDVAQRVFIKAFENRRQLEDADEPRAVLCWMASRMALTHLRGDRRRRRREVERAMNVRDQSESDAPSFGLEEGDRTIFDGIFRKLPEDLRVALTLRFQDDLTFAQIGDVMTVSEASAHDRVRRGLERLRETLRRGGLAAFAVNAEHHLLETPAEPIPSGLVERLLEARPSSLLSASLATPLVVGALVTVIVGAVAIMSWRKSTPASPIEAGVVLSSEEEDAEPIDRRVASGERFEIATESGADAIGEAVPSGHSNTADSRTGRISGTITSPDGSGAVGVLVVANSYILESKLAAYGGHSETDAHGQFTIEVPVRHDDGEDYSVVVKYDQAILTRGRDARVRAEAEITGFDIELEHALEKRDGEYELLLELRDEEGALFPRESIVVVERYLHTIGGGTFPHWEGSGRLDATGSVLLRGSKLGPKRVTVRVRGQDSWDEAWAIFDVLEQGRSTRLVTARSRRNAPGLFQRDATLDDEENRRGHWLAGFQSELVSGEPILRSYPDVWVYEVPELTSADYLYDFLPNKIFRNSFQTAMGWETPEASAAFSLKGLKPARYVAVGYESPYAPAFSEVVALSEDSPTAEGLHLCYEKGGTVSGTVRDVDGSPLPLAIVFITGTGALSNERTTTLDAKVRKAAGEGIFVEKIWRTDSSGRFTIAGLPSSVPVRVMALSPTRSPAASITVYAPSETEVSGVDIRFVTVRTR